MTEPSMEEFYRETVVIDGLNVSNWDSSAVYRSLKKGGVTAINATIATWEGFRDTLDNLASWTQRFAEVGELLQIKSVNDIKSAKRANQVGIILGFQNASPIENDLNRLELFHKLGVRIIQVTYHERNLLGNGCYERVDDGLSNFGLDAVKEMNRVGILIDLSHVGDKTTIETIETSERPVAITHANARSYHDVPRNKTDDALKLLAARGGVVGATAITGFMRTGEKSTLDDYIDAIDHMVGLVGIDHVAIGTDFTQEQPWSFWKYIGSQQGTKYPSTFVNPEVYGRKQAPYPIGFETPENLPDLAFALLKRGYKQTDVCKIIGENWLRLFQEVW